MPTIITKIGQYQGASTKQMPAAHLTRTMQLLEKTCYELDTELANELSGLCVQGTCSAAAAQ